MECHPQTLSVLMMMCFIRFAMMYMTSLITPGKVNLKVSCISKMKRCMIFLLAHKLSCSVGQNMQTILLQMYWWQSTFSLIALGHASWASASQTSPRVGCADDCSITHFPTHLSTCPFISAFAVKQPLPRVMSSPPPVKPFHFVCGLCISYTVLVCLSVYTCTTFSFLAPSSGLSPSMISPREGTTVGRRVPKTLSSITRP